MKAEFKPLKFKRVSTTGVDLADLDEWVPMEVDPYFGEPMQIVKDTVAFFTRGVLLKMREPR